MRNVVISFRTIPRKIRCSEFDSEPFRRRGSLFRTTKQKKKTFKNSFWNMMMLWKVFLLLLFWFAEFCSVLFGTLEWANMRHTEFRERSTIFRGITKTVPSLFLGIFSERNFYGNHICTAPSLILWKTIFNHYWLTVNKESKSLRIWEGQKVFTKLHYFLHLTITNSSKKIKMFAAPFSIDVKNWEDGTKLAAGSIYFVRSGFCSNFLRVPAGSSLILQGGKKCQVCFNQTYLYRTVASAHVYYTLQRRSDLWIPRNETARPRSQFPHSHSTFMCLWLIYIFPRSVHLFCWTQ